MQDGGRGGTAEGIMVPGESRSNDDISLTVLSIIFMAIFVVFVVIFQEYKIKITRREGNPPSQDMN